jgi:hypothetical protein
LPKYYHREGGGQSAKRAEHLFPGGTLLLQMKVACRVSTAQSPIGRFRASDYYRQVNVRLNH